MHDRQSPGEAAEPNPSHRFQELIVPAISTAPPRLKWYAISIGAVVAALLFTVGLGDWIEPNIFPPFLIAVLFCSRYGGMGPGLTATALSTAACFALLARAASLGVDPTTIAVRLTMFASVQVLIVYLMVGRTRTEQALRESEASHRAMFELAGVGWVQIDPKTGGFLRVNRRMCEITGYDRGELLALTVKDITCPEDITRDWQQARLLVRGEIQELVTEKRLVGKNQRLVWVQCNATLIRDTNGRPLRVVGVIQDVNARKLAEEERERQFVRQRLLAEAIGHLLISEPKQMVNGLFERVSDSLGLSGYLNYMVDEPGKSLLLHSYSGIPDQAARAITHLQFNQGVSGTVAASRRPIVAADIQNSADPKVQLVKGLGAQAYFCNPLLAGDRLLGTLSFTLSDRKHFDEHELDFLRTVSHYVALAKEQERLLKEARERAARLEESEQRFRQLADNIEDAFWMHDVASGRRVYVSPAFERLFGWSPDLAQSAMDEVYDAIHPADRQRVQTAFREKAPEGLYDEEYRVVRPDGTVRWVRDRGFVIKAPDGVVGRLVGIASDTTERKQAEEELRDAKEVAELATRAKDHFLAVLSHELRTPLTPVLMAATAMLDNSRTCLSFRPTLAMIRDNILLEVRLIEDLLDVSRLGHGQMTYHFETVDVHALVERCVDICRHEHVTEHRLLEADLGAFEHHVNGDPVRLQQVIWNLLTNATKYTSEGGRIAIRTRSVARGYLTVEVEDDGIGIDPVLIPRVFEAFERGDGAALHHVRGLGLGLTLSRAFVEAHGGKLKAASEGRDRGARFTLELGTISKPSNALDLPAPSTASASRPLRILLAEDNVVTAQVFAQVLGDKGHKVTTATCLRQALEIAYGDVDFDVVVSDIDLTDGSGLDLMRLVRTRSDTPGIALSGYATKDDIRESAEAGFAVHLAKPVTLEMLESAIQNAVRQDGMSSITLCSASRS